MTLARSACQGWQQIGELGLAFVLSSLIGLEREWRQKSAGLRTHTLVGVGAALFILISKYGFNDVLSEGRVVLDPSRVAAGWCRASASSAVGLIFVRKDIVRGLTTAAIVWITAAIGMACGAGLALLALVVTAAHFVVVFVYPGDHRRGCPRRAIWASACGWCTRTAAASCARSSARARGLGLAIHRMATQQIEGGRIAGRAGGGCDVRGSRQARRSNELTLALDKLDGVLGVEATDFLEDLGLRTPTDVWLQRELTLQPQPRGFHLVTREVLAALPELRTWTWACCMC